MKAVGVDADAATSLARRFGFDEAAVEWRKPLEDRRVDVVNIALPTALRYEAAKAILQADKHILCEKPLAMSPADAWELVRVAE